LAKRRISVGIDGLYAMAMNGVPAMNQHDDCFKDIATSFTLGRPNLDIARKTIGKTNADIFTPRGGHRTIMNVDMELGTHAQRRGIGTWRHRALFNLSQKAM
jgi:hypothetical protein